MDTPIENLKPKNALIGLLVAVRNRLKRLEEFDANAFWDERHRYGKEHGFRYTFELENFREIGVQNSYFDLFGRKPTATESRSESDHFALSSG